MKRTRQQKETNILEFTEDDRTPINFKIIDYTGGEPAAQLEFGDPNDEENFIIFSLDHLDLYDIVTKCHDKELVKHFIDEFGVDPLKGRLDL